ncbi:hypothetical protein B0T21DRAFT_387481 [Apiosordaria backusii]|uniref:Uncharacterized protein n=1 Tax=Apiosordaria backusii TaxID=314023 RepID=A0AA40A3T3_9PEZI|nr:hypothetical protein B0T21DRAFT_387481 [Apiosordaria backusii]
MSSRRNHLEDIPPPPYSETDIYSTTSGPSPINPTPPTTASFRRNSSNSDDTSTNDGEIIYTPPLTPRSAQSNTVDFVPAPSAPLGVSPSPERTDRTPEAQAYFDSRPLSGVHVGNVTTVEITLANDPAQTDLETIAGIDRITIGNGDRDVTREDWMTFVNYLLPGFVERTNERVVNRKLRAEGIENSSHNGSEKGGDGNGSDRSQAEVLLDRIRSPTGSEDGVEGVEAKRERVERMDQQREERMPGGWEERFDSAQGQGQSQSQSQTQGQGQQQRGPGGWMGRFGPFGGIDGERISIGDSFVVDGRTGHLKIGGIVADTNGISINGWSPGNMFGGRGGHQGRGGPGGWCYPPGRMGCPPPAMGAGMPGMPACPPRWAWGGAGGRGACGGQRPERSHHYFGRGGRGGWWSHRWAQGPTQQEQPGQRGQEGEQGVNTAQDAGPSAAQDQDRGRPQQPSSKDRHRSRSSSASSISSRSSSSSESSAGSLPAYDELKDTELPAMKAYLSESLRHPEQQITKEKVRQAKQQLREARREINEPVNMAHDRKALRREVKELMREWKQLKKEQKRQRRQLRKEKRQRRKEERRERRQTRKEMRRAEKEFHRHGHRGGPPPPHGPPPRGPPPPHGPHHLPPHGPPLPQMPPPQMPMPPMPMPMPMPHMPMAPPPPHMQPHGPSGLPPTPQSQPPPSYRGLSFDAPANGPPTPTGFPFGRPGPLPPGAWPQESDNTTPQSPPQQNTNALMRLRGRSLSNTPTC